MKDFVDILARDARLERQCVHRGVFEARGARHAAPDCGLPEGAQAGLDELGVPRLWTHQAEALELAAAGRNALLATPTASGKTLAYLLALAQRRSRDPEARAIFLYPLKALARDQLGTLRRYLAAQGGLLPGAAAEVYDGDTPEGARRKIRKAPPCALITNPDMLHLGILPHHETWSHFLSKLALVVIDEAHVYRGVFGAHVHHVLRRLLRLARAHGAAPQLIAGSATIGEPGTFIETLTGEPFTVVGDSGAPVARRHVVFLRPDGVSPYTTATHTVALAVQEGHKTIAFTKARRITELMHRWLREQHPRLSGRIASYRSGYLPEERRAIEGRLFSGELGGVISTSALEAGIDVGGLDVCVLVGYPGSLATSWQRIGRTGRGARESLAVLVAMPDALDQYVVRHPEHFFSGSFERVVLDPQNDTIADAHFQVAAAERSLDQSDARALGGEPGPARVLRLEEEGSLVRAHEEERWFCLRRRPQREIHLRSSGSPYSLLRASDGRLLGTLDEARAWHEGHPGAIYLHAGETYRVLDLDPEEHAITLEAAKADYFTQVYARKETEILERFEERKLGPAKLVWGRLRVTTFVEGYARRRLYTQEEISRHPLEAPPLELETVGFWFEAPRALLHALVEREHHPVGALHATEHATIGLFPLLAICDRWDLGGISYAHHPQLDCPAVFVFDGWPGGVGLARTGFERAEELLRQTRALVADCPCEDGCPSCVHSPKCGSGNHPLDKEGAVHALDLLLGDLPLDEPEADEERDARLGELLAPHRNVRHAGVRGGGALPEAFFAGDETAASGAEPSAAGTPQSPASGGVARLDSVDWPEDLPHPSALLGEDEGHWLFFDIETLRSAEDVGGWHRIREMGLALAVTLDAETGEFKSWYEEDAEALVDALLAADRVVGFNSERFDLTVLEYYAGEKVRRIKSLDLLRVIKERVSRRFSLSHLAEETLGRAKSGDGLQSLEWVRDGRFDLVERYCRDDVALTAAIWAYGRRHRYLLFRSKEGTVGRIPVRW